MPVAPSPVPPPIAPAADSVRARILLHARLRFFRDGYGAFTMDDLATDAGISKKTLYVHFKSKRTLCRELISAVAEEIRRDAETVLRDPGLTFLEKLRGFAQGMMERFSRLGPDVLPDLARRAPDLHRHLERVRAKNVPYVFGRLIEEGQVAGVVRDDISPVFVAEFHLHAMQGLMHPATQQRLHLTPPQTFDQAIRLLFGGLLTPAGQKEYEKFFTR
jgi:AcrR family transcriptional regulator